MGRRVGAIVQMEFSMDSYRYERDSKKYFSDGFFDFYDCEKKDQKHFFKIKEDLLLENYGDFLLEFYQIIGEDLGRYEKIPPESELLKLKDMSSFISAFDRHERNGSCPILCDDRFVVSALYCDSKLSWVFYFGSYKAYLEEYSTFTHFERILVKAMKNPLAKAVKFCEYG